MMNVARTFLILWLAGASLLAPALTHATVIDFDGVGPVGAAPPTISVGGVSVSFSNLEISEIGELSNGFGGQAGSNQVVAADSANFNGQFLTAAGFARAQFRTPGFVRTIEFDTPVSGVSMYIADVDAQEGITANAYDELGVLLSRMVFPGSLSLDSQVLLVDFGSLSGIRKVTLVGNDPVGIDNLSFLSAASGQFELQRVLTNNEFRFGAPVALDGNVALIGSPSTTSGGAALTWGSASTINTVTGEILQRFDNPNPGAIGAVDTTDFYAHEQFRTVAIEGGHVFVASFAEDVAAIDSGAVYVFDADTGALIRTLTHPNPIPEFGGPGFGQGFGREIAVDGDEILIGSQVGEAYLYNYLTGELTNTFAGQFPGTLGFANTVALSPEYVALNTLGNASGGSVWIYDRSSGAFLREIANPTPESADFFGDAIAIQGDRILIGTRQVDISGVSNAGEASLFDITNGQLLNTFVDPTPNANATFGGHLDIDGDVVAISAVGDNEAHVFDANTGDLLQTLSETLVRLSFGTTVDLDNGNLLVGTPFDGALFYTRAGTNEPPTANAGVDLSARAGDTVTLDGTASFDDNTATSELIPSWTIVSAPPGSTANLVNANTLTPSLFIDVSGTYEVELTVADAVGLVSAPDTVVISAVNLAPTADAGPDQLTYLNSTVVLDGSGSFDPEGDPITYDWLVTSPSGVELSLTGAQSSLTVVEEGDYTTALTVADFLGPGLIDTAVVTVAAADEFVQISVLRANDIVIALDATEVTTAGNQNALTNFFAQAVRLLQKGNIADAITKLENALNRTDGCAERGVPDEGDDENERDWIVSCGAQATVYSEISSALAALRAL